jgi:hypothetical protein
MSGGNRHKAKGTAFETQVLRYLRKRGFIRAYRPPTQGKHDLGDINGIETGAGENIIGENIIVQCKNAKQFKLSEWLNATQHQAANKQALLDTETIGVLVAKRPGVGEATLGKTYAILELDDLITLLEKAGYG